MSQTSKQDYTKIIRACAKANEYQLNIAVVGNVESGKSIFIDALTEYFRDGVECQARGRVMRNKRSAFEYLSNILVASLTTSLAETEKRVRLDNKSFDSVYHDAVVYYKEGGLINQKEFDFLTKFYESAKKTITEPVNLIIWVDTDPVKCLARIEDKKTFDYDYSLEQLQMLDKIYKNWLNGDVGVKVVRIDGNLPEEELKSIAVEIAIATRRQYTDKL